MEIIKDKSFGGERPLFGIHDTRLENVTIDVGESSLKHCQNIEADHCEFNGKYPFWHTEDFKVTNCVFHEGARAALWYSRGLVMRDTLIEAPKMFREMEGMEIENVKIPNAQETFWHCENVSLKNVQVDNGDYIFMNCANVRIQDYVQNGNYSFQYASDVVIRNAELHTKDAFWMTENVTVYDSEIDGEYLGWHSHNLHLIRCRISGSQPLCYATDLVMEDCTIAPDCDRAFEYSTLKAEIHSPVTSVTNPRSGSIVADSYGQVNMDNYKMEPSDCRILTWSDLRDEKHPDGK